MEQVMNTQSANVIVVLLLTGLAFFLRFYKIGHPDQVVYVVSRYTSRLLTNMISFDEVHFGKFAGFYIKREYYFDVHPPFAKLLFGLAGWFVGFDGQFQFENIGDSYTENHVPYVGMRALSAIFGSLTIPVVYGIMKESGYSTVVAAFSASLVLFGMIIRPYFICAFSTGSPTRQRSCRPVPFDIAGFNSHILHGFDHLFLYPVPEASLSVSHTTCFRSTPSRSILASSH